MYDLQTSPAKNFFKEKSYSWNINTSRERERWRFANSDIANFNFLLDAEFFALWSGSPSLSTGRRYSPYNIELRSRNGR